MAKPLSIYSWNVNGIRAATKKGFADWFASVKPDYLGLQEVRAEFDQIAEEVREPKGYKSHFVAAERKGYSGVGQYVKGSLAKERELSLSAVALDETLPLGSKRKTATPNESFEIEGRLQCCELGELLVVNGYFPNGNGKDRDNSRVPYKLEFYERLRAVLQPEFERGRAILVMGDWNTAHTAHDLARPKTNEKTSGFLPEEREGFSLWTEAGWVDTFRHFQPAPSEDELKALALDAKSRGLKKAERDLHPGEGHYTWWSQRAGVREKNVGWRIDYVLASPSAMKFVRGAKIHPDVLGSDHCPISVEVDRSILEE